MELKLLGERIKLRRDSLNLTQDDIAARIGVAKSTIQRYETAKIGRPKLPVIDAIANVLQVNPEWLCGKTDEMRENTGCSDSLSSFENIRPIETKRFPLLGEIACGQPIFANEDRESYIEAGSDIKADFCLKCRGNSMINARINDGDIVFVRSQPTVNNGEIAAVVIDDEATLKRVYQSEGYVTLMAENPEFAPIVVSQNDGKSVYILGKAVAFQSDIK